MIYVDLSHQKMAQLSVAQVSSVQHLLRTSLYQRVGAQEGFTASDLSDAQDKLEDGKYQIAPLPHGLYAMGSVNHVTGKTHVFHMVTALPDRDGQPQKGIRIALESGKVMWLPLSCFNLTIQSAPRPMPFRNVSYRHYFPPTIVLLPSMIPASTITAEPLPAPDLPVTPVTATATSGVGNALYALPLGPFFGGLFRGSPVVPPCNQGSNTLGVCR